MGNIGGKNARQAEAVLGGVSFFSHLGDAELSALASLFSWRTVAPTRVILAAGDRMGSDFFIVARGCVRVVRPESGEELYRKHTCDFFGQDALHDSEASGGAGDGSDTDGGDGGVYETDFVAGEDGAELLVLPRAEFEVNKRLVTLAPLRDMLEHSRLSSVMPLLRNIPFFVELDNSALRRLANLLVYEVYAPGRVICHEGNPGDAMHIILRGKVAVTAENHTGEKGRYSPYTAEGFVVKRSNAKTHHWQRRLLVVADNVCSYYKVDLGSMDWLDGEIRNPSLSPSSVSTRIHNRIHQRRARLAEAALPDIGTKRLAAIPPRCLSLRGQFIVLDVREAAGKQHPINIIGDDRTIRVRTGSREARALWLKFFRDGMKSAALELARRPVSGGRSAADQTPAGKLAAARRASFSVASAHALSPSSTASEVDTESGDNRRRFKHRVSVAARERDVVGEDSIRNSVLLCELGPGAYVGEVSLVTDMVRSATVSTITDVVALALPRAFFSVFLTMLPGRARENINSLARQRTATTLKRLDLPFLNGMSERRLALVAQASRLRRLQTGDVVFRQGDEGDSFYMIVHGEVVVMVQATGADGAPTGDPREVNRLSAGGYFGEIALITAKPRLATVKVSSPTTLLELAKPDFITLFAKESPSAVADFGLKLFREGCELLHVLYHPVGFRLFAEELAKEYSAENVWFWKAAHEFGIHYAKLEDELDAATVASGGAGSSTSSLLSLDAAAAGSAGGAGGGAAAKLRSNTASDVPELSKTVSAPVQSMSRGASWTVGGSTSRPASARREPSFRITAGPRTRAAMCAAAKSIIAEFVDDDAPRQINIKSTVRSALDARVAADAIDSHLFDDAKAEIYLLMEKDNFARFKRSPAFAALLQDVGAYETSGDSGSAAQAARDSMRKRSSANLTISTGHSGRAQFHAAMEAMAAEAALNAAADGEVDSDTDSASGSADAGSADGENADAGSADGGSADEGSADGGIVDGGSADGERAETGSADAGGVGGAGGATEDASDGDGGATAVAAAPPLPPPVDSGAPELDEA